MAGAIKGITIEIGGNTTKLDKALRDVNSKSKDLNKQLRDVNKSLKFNPKNTELLAQKQRLLAENVENTKTKLDALKQAEAQVQAQFQKGDIGQKEYDEFRRELIKTEDQLKHFNTELEKSQSKAKAFGEGLKTAGDNIKNVGNKMKPVSAAAAVAGGAMIKLGSDFDESMAKVSTIADANVPMDELKQSIIDLSNESGIAAPQIAEDVYNAISAGQETGDAVNFVANATKLAKAGFTESGDALDVLTTIMNAYGLEAEKVTDVSDMLIQIQNKGKTTVGELSSVMGKVIPTANGLNVGLEELGAGYAILTSNGIRTAEATTYMNAMFNELGKTGSKTDKALKQMYGKSFKELKEEGMSTGDVLQELKEYAEANDMALNDLFGSAEAGKAAFTLLKDGADGFNSSVKDMVDSTGATEEAFLKVQTPSEEFRKAINKMLNAMVQIGEKAAPAIEAVAGFISNLADKFQGLSAPAQTFILVITGILAVLAPLLIFVGKIVGALGTLITFFSAGGAGAGLFGAALGVLTGPIGIVIGIITALIAIGVALYENWDYISEKAQEVGQIIGDAWNAMVEVVKGVLEVLWTWIKEKFDNITKAIQTAHDLIKSITQNGWQLVQNTVQSVMNAISSTISSIWNGISSTVSNVVNGISSTVSGVFNGIKSTVDSVWNGIKSTITNTINGARDAVKSAIDRIKGFFNFSWSLPKLKLPHISISGGFSLMPPRVPHFGISWYKKGAIFNKPTIFNTPSGLKGVGEAGAEAVLPIEKLSSIFADTMRQVGGDNNSQLASVLENISKPIVINIDGKEFARIIAPLMSEELQFLNKRQLQGSGY